MDTTNTNTPQRGSAKLGWELWHDVLLPFISRDCPVAMLTGARLSFYFILISSLVYLLHLDDFSQAQMLNLWMQLSVFLGLGILALRVIGWIQPRPAIGADSEVPTEAAPPPTPPPDLFPLLRDVLEPLPPPETAWTGTTGQYEIATSYIRVTPTQRIEFRWGRCMTDYPQAPYIVSATAMQHDPTTHHWYPAADLTDFYVPILDEMPLSEIATNQTVPTPISTTPELQYFGQIGGSAKPNIVD